MQDTTRVNFLIDAAAKQLGSDTALAEALGKSKQVISDWRHGRKSPSVEVQAELAAMGGCDIAKVVVMALIEGTTGIRQRRIQAGLREEHRYNPQDPHRSRKW